MLPLLRYLRHFVIHKYTTLNTLNVLYNESMAVEQGASRITIVRITVAAAVFIFGVLVLAVFPTIWISKFFGSKSPISMSDTGIAHADASNSTYIPPSNGGPECQGGSCGT